MTQFAPAANCRISVAICTYNGERYLRDQLESINAQTLQPLEVVICDDGSTDGTLAIAANYQRGVQFDVRVVRNTTNLGVVRNFEKAVSLCRGELIALADQDDVWYPNKLKSLSEYMFQNPTRGGVFCDADIIDDRSQTTGEHLWDLFRFGENEQRLFDRGDGAHLLCLGEFVTGATLMFRTSLRPYLLPVGGGWLHDGWFAWMLILYSHLGYIPERLMAYRVHSAQQSGVGPRHLRQRLAKMCQSLAPVHAEKARRFESLRARCSEWGGCREETLADITELIEFCRMRSSLPGAALSRAACVLPKIPLYRRYSRWIRAIARDIVQG